MKPIPPARERSRHALIRRRAVGIGLLIIGAARAASAVEPASGQPEYSWERVTAEAPFAPRDGAGTLVHRNRMWLLGGWNPRERIAFPAKCNNEVWSSADGRTWKLEAPNTFGTRRFDPLARWEGRHTAGYGVLDGRMWVVGGDPLQGHYQSDVWASADGVSWELLSSEAPWGPRVLHMTAVFNGRLWVMGGQTLPGFAPAPEMFYDDIWTSADGAAWERVPVIGPSWSPRGMIGGQAVFMNRMWVLGGGTYDTPQVRTRKFHNDVWSTADGSIWTPAPENAPWPPRQYHSVAVFDERLWVIAGYGGEAVGNMNDVWHSPDGVNWFELPGTPWSPRHAAGLFVHDESLWVVAGSAETLTNDVWRLTRRTGPGGAD